MTAETVGADVAAGTCRHCGAVIKRHEGLGGTQWRDLSQRSSSTCFKARNLVHEPEAPSGQGAGEQEPQGTRVEAGNETSEQPRAIRADTLTAKTEISAVGLNVAERAALVAAQSQWAPDGALVIAVESILAARTADHMPALRAADAAGYIRGYGKGCESAAAVLTAVRALAEELCAVAGSEAGA